MVKTKRIAIVASGWHFPIHFYQEIAGQMLPAGWEMDLFCISHRDPAYAVEEKKGQLAELGYSRRDLYDRIMYSRIASVPEIENLGWNYSLTPNTIGDWGNVNQWLETHDYREYDMFLFTHDDNFILNRKMLVDLIPDAEWLILTNSSGNAQRRLRQYLRLPKPLNIRGSFEFFTKEMMDLMGGKFDLSETTLSREGKFTTTNNFGELNDWNTTVFPLQNLIKEKKLEPRIKSLSPFYRMSKYCLEGERGYISKFEKSNFKEEEKGLDFIEKFYNKDK